MERRGLTLLAAEERRERRGAAGVVGAALDVGDGDGCEGGRNVVVPTKPMLDMIWIGYGPAPATGTVTATAMAGREQQDTRSGPSGRYSSFHARRLMVRGVVPTPSRLGTHSALTTMSATARSRWRSTERGGWV